MEWLISDSIYLQFSVQIYGNSQRYRFFHSRKILKLAYIYQSTSLTLNFPHLKGVLNKFQSIKELSR